VHTVGAVGAYAYHYAAQLLCRYCMLAFPHSRWSRQCLARDKKPLGEHGKEPFQSMTWREWLSN
jgi:hypothetical protein